jgi:hypothetical protein
MKFKSFFTEIHSLGLSSPGLAQVQAPAAPVVAAPVAALKIDKNELIMGIKVEMEHTTDPRQAAKIALDHLKENPKYYSGMKRAGLADELKDGKEADENFKDTQQYSGKIGGTPEFPDADRDTANVVCVSAIGLSSPAPLSPIQEGGAKMLGKGLTSDMKGKRWTISAYTHDKENKKETPPLEEEFAGTTKHTVKDDHTIISGEENKENFGEKNRLDMTEIHSVADKSDRLRKAFENCGLPDCPYKHKLTELVNLMESIYHNIDVRENATGMKKGFTNEQAVKVAKVGNINAGQIRESIARRIDHMIKLAECGNWEELNKAGLEKTVPVWESIFHATK